MVRRRWMLKNGGHDLPHSGYVRQPLQTNPEGLGAGSPSHLRARKPSMKERVRPLDRLKSAQMSRRLGRMLSICPPKYLRLSLVRLSAWSTPLFHIVSELMERETIPCHAQQNSCHADTCTIGGVSLGRSGEAWAEDCGHGSHAAAGCCEEG
jgi:hypothetical protein